MPHGFGVGLCAAQKSKWRRGLSSRVRLTGTDQCGFEKRQFYTKFSIVDTPKRHVLGAILRLLNQHAQFYGQPFDLYGRKIEEPEREVKTWRGRCFIHVWWRDWDHLWRFPRHDPNRKLQNCCENFQDQSICWKPRVGHKTAEDHSRLRNKPRCEFMFQWSLSYHEKSYSCFRRQLFVHSLPVSFQMFSSVLNNLQVLSDSNTCYISHVICSVTLQVVYDVIKRKNTQGYKQIPTLCNLRRRAIWKIFTTFGSRVLGASKIGHHRLWRWEVTSPFDFIKAVAWHFCQGIVDEKPLIWQENWHSRAKNRRYMESGALHGICPIHFYLNVKPFNVITRYIIQQLFNECENGNVGTVIKWRDRFSSKAGNFCHWIHVGLNLTVHKRIMKMAASRRWTMNSASFWLRQTKNVYRTLKGRC